MNDLENLRDTAEEMLSGLEAEGRVCKRLQFVTTALDDLPQIAGEMLGSLHATPALRHRILVAYDRRNRKLRTAHATHAPRPVLTRFTPAMGMALALVLMLGIGVFYGNPQPTTPILPGVLESYAASSLTTEAGVPQYRTLFAGEGVNPPLLGINGRYYRMLNTPAGVPSSLLGTALAEVQTVTSEPSLAPVGVISNVVAVGTTVYSINGVSTKTAVLAEVDSVLRVFQRVGYAATSTVGNEMFEDTLDVIGQVLALELSGVGLVLDPSAANELVYMLTEFAVWSGSELPETGQALTIYLENGLSLQLNVQDDTVAACGAWVCPEFFTAFREAMV